MVHTKALHGRLFERKDVSEKRLRTGKMIRRYFKAVADKWLICQPERTPESKPPATSSTLGGPICSWISMVYSTYNYIERVRALREST